MFYLNTRSIQIISASHMFPGLSRRESVSECPCLAAWEDWPGRGMRNYSLQAAQSSTEPRPGQSDAGEKYALSLDWNQSDHNKTENQSLNHSDSRWIKLNQTNVFYF